MFSHVRCSVPGAYLAIKIDVLLFSVLSVSACYISPGPHDPLLLFNSFSSASPFWSPFSWTPTIYWIPWSCVHLRCAFDHHVLNLYLFRVLPLRLGGETAFCHILLTRKREAIAFNCTLVSLATQIMKPADKIPNQSQIHFK